MSHLRAVCMIRLIGYPATAQELAGLNRGEGRNADGSACSDHLRLSASGQGFRGDWTIAGERFRGMGALEGRILTLPWEDNAHPVV